MSRIKIACVGDSITYGSTLKFRRLSNYPHKLSNALNPKYIIRNFGVPGACVIENSEKPYIKEKSYKKSLNYQPDILLIMLGTNDSKKHNWNRKKFRFDYVNLINTYKKSNSDLKIYLLTPIPAFDHSWNIQPSIIRQVILPIITNICIQLDIELIDVFTPFNYNKEFTTDNIHPNRFGTKLIADVVSNNINIGDRI